MVPIAIADVVIGADCETLAVVRINAAGLAGFIGSSSGAAGGGATSGGRDIALHAGELRKCGRMAGSDGGFAGEGIVHGRRMPHAFDGDCALTEFSVPEMQFVVAQQLGKGGIPWSLRIVLGRAGLGEGLLVSTVLLQMDCVEVLCSGSDVGLVKIGPHLGAEFVVELLDKVQVSEKVPKVYGL